MIKIALIIYLQSFVQIIQSQSVEVWMSNPNQNLWLIQKPEVNFNSEEGSEQYTIDVIDSIKYQEMDGFGASLTDASCWLIKNKLSDSFQIEVLHKLFSKEGIGLSLLRQPIGASDFNWEAWTLDDTDNNNDDWNLSRFSLWREDAYIWPILQKALQVSPQRIKIFGSPWSPPAWMKSGKHLFGAQGGYLRPECYEVYANYFVRVVNEYKKRGSPLYAITIQNEPQNDPNNYPGMKMSSANQIGFIRDYLGPKFRNLQINTKIIAFDHNYDKGGFQFVSEILSNSGANKLCDGIGFHTYTSPGHQYMSQIHDIYKKDVWITEAGSGTWIQDQFQDQIMHMIRSPRNWAKGVLFWNIALDQNSGPKLANVDSDNSNRGFLTIRSDTMNSFSYETSYYSMGHSSKFVDPGAKRIESNSFENDIENVAYQNADNSKVLVISNRTPNQRNIKVRWNSKSFTYILPGKSAITFKWDGSQSKKIVTILSMANKKYVTLNAEGVLIASSDFISDDSKFEIISINSSQFALKSVSNGKFVSADNNGNSPLIANRQIPSLWEYFEHSNLKDGTQGIKAVVNGKFVCAENVGKDALIANRQDVDGSWEAFQILDFH